MFKKFIEFLPYAIVLVLILIVMNVGALGGDTGWPESGNADLVPMQTEEPVSVPAPANLNAVPNQGRPLISWTEDELAEWYRVYIGNNDYSIQVFDEWFARNAVCEAGECSVKPDVNPAGGTYHVWMQAWGNGQYSSGGDTGFPGWSTVDFVLPSIPPAPITSLTATVAANGNTTFTWQGVPGATWYNVWVGTDGEANPPWQQFFFDWMLAENLGCENAEVCTLTQGVALASGATYNLNLSSGEYVWYIQSWGPGGFSTGGIADAPSWVQAPNFIVP